MEPRSTIPKLPKRTKLGESHVTKKLRDLQQNFKSACTQLNILLQRRTAEKALSAAKDSSAATQSAAICPVCMDDLHTPHTVITLCGHVFHRQCLDRHFKTPSGSKCPMCRSSIQAGELIIVRNGFSEVDSAILEPVDLESSKANVQTPSGSPSDPIDVDTEDCNEKEAVKSGIDETIIRVLESMHDLSSRTGIFIELEQALRRENQRKIQETLLDLEMQQKDLEKRRLEHEKKFQNLSKLERGQEKKKKELDMREMKLNEEIKEHAKKMQELEKEKSRLLSKTSAVHLKAERLSQAQTAIREKESRLNILINAQENRPMKRRRVLPTEKPALSGGSVEPGFTPFSFSSTQGMNHLSTSLRSDDSRRAFSRPRPVGVKQRGVKLNSFAPRTSSAKRSMPGVAQRR